MLVTNNITISKLVLHLNKYTSDKIFNYNTYFNSKYDVADISILYRYKKHMKLLVSLRAPKHFKVGRQQYNMYRGLIYIVVNFKNNTQGFTINNNDGETVLKVSERICDDIPYTMISEHSCVKFKYRVSCNFII